MIETKFPTGKKPKEHLITSAPNQNTDWGIMGRERAIPLLLAQTIQNTREYVTGEDEQRFLLWNTYGSKMDTQYRDFARQNPNVSRSQYNSDQLNKKYQFLADLGLDVQRAIVETDDSEEFEAWAIERMREYFNAGLIYKERAKFNVCADCGNVIAESAVPISKCNRCKSENIKHEEHEGLFIDIPTDKSKLYEDKIYGSNKLKHLNGKFATLPPRMMIHRNRDTGLKLDEFGIPDAVLDPKIAACLMPEFIAWKYDYQEVTQIQGLPTVTNTVPYTSILNQARKYLNTYILISYVPQGSYGFDQNEASIQEINFFTKYLPLFLIGRQKSLSDSELLQLKLEYLKTQRKLENSLKVLNTETLQYEPMDQADFKELQDSVQKLLKYDIRAGMIGVRSFVYEMLSKKYAGRQAQGGASIDRSDLENLNKIFSLIF